MRTVSMREEWEGRTIDGRFPLLEWLGGSTDRAVFLTVLQGIQTATIKLIVANDTNAAAHLVQWERAKALSHPHLVQIFETDRYAADDNNLVYVVTERTEKALSQIIQERALDAGEAGQILDAILDALSYLHTKGFVHSDIKPSNILLIDGDWKLSGEDVLLSGGVPNRVLQPGIYDAPELATGAPTAASDIWSLGMTLAEALTQRTLTWDPPARGGPIVPESVPQPFLDIVRGCTRFDPEQRCNIRQVRARLPTNHTHTVATKPTAAPAEEIPVSPDPVPAASDTIPASFHRISVTKDSTPSAAVRVDAAPEPRQIPREPNDAFSSRGRSTESVETEPLPELFPRPLFSDIEEENRRSMSWRPVVIGALILFAAGAAYFTRDRWMTLAQHVMTQIVPAPAPAPAPPSSTPSPAPTGEATQQPQSPAAPPSQAQTAPGTEQAAPHPQSPAPSEPKTQTAPATGETAPEPRQPESKTPMGGTAEGAVAKRVLPRPSPSATASIRGTVKVGVRVSVNRSGSVSSATYLSHGPGNYFARIAVQAARSWKFRPPRLNGHTRPSTWALHFSFWKSKTEATAAEIH